MRRISRFIVTWMTFLIVLPLQAEAEELLVPVGRIVGLQLRSDSIMVAAYDDVLGSEARTAGLKIGDEILQIDGQKINCVDDVPAALSSGGERVALTVRRGSKVDTVNMAPQQTQEGPRLGVYLRQGIAGIGTITFYDPDTGLFGTLGHGVSDARGSLLRMTQGSAYQAQIVSIQKGKSGKPGQLKGSAEAAVCGTLLRNTPQGVFGIAQPGWKGEAMPVAEYEQIQTGSAKIRCQVAGDSVQEYSVEILKIYPESRADGRNFLIKVTDPDLLETTGGIVQGMSGSPICQNGKIVGAVTHVLVNDPTMGYGIFIENMLDAAG